jgi:hypothetical protein
MKIYTTINPYGNFNRQNESIKTWSNHYQVYSVNLKEEIEKIESLYPDVIFIETDNVFNYNDKKLIKMNAILESIDKSDIAAIVNSDISLNESMIIDVDSRFLKNGIVIGTRYEIDNGKIYPFIYGYDIFIFNPKNIDLILNDNYVIGMPWWDYWVPLAFIKKGMNVYHMKNQVIYHKTHETNYDMDIWLEFGKCFYNDIVRDILNYNNEMTLDEFIAGNFGEQMDIKKYIESKQINIDCLVKQIDSI